MKMARKVFSVLLVVMLVGSLGFAFFTVTDAFSKLGNIADSHFTNATLASADAQRHPTATFAVTYWKQSNDQCIDQYDIFAKNIARQFEWQKCGAYNDAIEPGLIKSKLGDDFLPIPSYDSMLDAKVAGLRFSNRGIYTGNFKRWFHSMDGLSAEQNNVIQLTYSADTDTYSYKNTDFHPTGDSLFTMNLAIPFQVGDTGHFEITADDDTWVFLNDDLKLDMGGIHHPTSASFDIAESGIIYIFHANRDSLESSLAIEMSHVVFPVSDTTIAYDNSSYIAPLGESTKSSPNYDNAIVSAITIGFTILGLLVLFTPFVIRVILHN